MILKKRLAAIIYISLILFCASIIPVFAVNKSFILSISSITYDTIMYTSDSGVDPPTSGSFSFNHKKEDITAAAVFSSGLNSSNNYQNRRAANSGGTEFISYQIYENDTSVSPWSDTINSDGSYSNFVYVTALSNPQTTSYTIPFTIKVPSGQIVSAGSYTDTVNLQFYADFDYITGVDFVSSLDTWTGSTSPIIITITVPGSAEITIAPTIAANNLVLFNGTGTVSNLKVATVTELSSDSGYTVTLTSKNAGKLIGESNRPDELIYTATYDGTSITLSATPQTISESLPATGFDGIDKDFAVSYTIIDNDLAGDIYSDILTFTIIGN